MAAGPGNLRQIAYLEASLKGATGYSLLKMFNVIVWSFSNTIMYNMFYFKNTEVIKGT